MAARDKTLFVEMGLPVSLQYLYERHKVPTPDPGEALFTPAKPVAQAVPPDHAPAEANACACDGARQREDGHAAGVAPERREGVSRHGNPQCGCGGSQCGVPIDAVSESTAELGARQAAAQAAFPQLVAEANAADEYLVWDATLDNRTTPLCQGRHGRRWGDGWFSPPPAHYHCRSTLARVAKTKYKTPS
jgi:hypothetical protein